LNNNVCIITSAHPVFDPRIFKKQAVSIKNAGYNVQLLAQHRRNEVVDGVEIIGFKKPISRVKRMFILSYQMIVVALKQRADIYHLHDPELLPWCILLKIVSRKAIIFDFHENVKKDIGSRYYIHPSFKIYITKLYSVVERISLKYIDHIILAEDSYRKDYNFTNSSLIHNYPIIQPEITKSTDKLLSPKKLESKLFTISAVGQVSKFRGSFDTLNALSVLIEQGYTNVRINFVGAFENADVREAFHELVELKKLDNYVKYFGQIKQSRVFQILGKSDIGLSLLHPIPNYLESYPTKIFEYFLTGIPVISSDFDYLREIIEGENCGLMVNPKNVNSIVEVIKYFYNNPKRTKIMGENGRRLVMAKYNWRSEEKRLISVYDDLSR
jgi:glycosyltransferase involved in cell wall biosynthesis